MILKEVEDSYQLYHADNSLKFPDDWTSSLTFEINLPVARICVCPAFFKATVLLWQLAIRRYNMGMPSGKSIALLSRCD